MPLQSIDPARYQDQLTEKLEQFKQTFASFDLPEPEVFASEPLHYRLRAEFHIHHEGRKIHYAMFAPGDSKTLIPIESFPAVAEPIAALMPRLLEALQGSNTLKDGLFRVDFLATLSGELLVTLVYHAHLGKRWEAAAQDLAASLKVQLMGRSKGRKTVLDRDWLLERFELNGRELQYQQIEGSFTQPNGQVNRKMLAWACQQAQGLGGDLLELYCGNGNFTMALAPMFRRVLATELSKSSVQAAEFNLEANQVKNVELARISSEELSEALTGEKTFKQLAHIDLGSYQFSTLFVDPPRSGLDAQTLELARRFDHILYISCNPETLAENVAALQESHQIGAAAVFDQFPYTHHLESGLLLSRR